MTAMNMTKTAYAATQNTVRTQRGIEYEAFARITHRLKSSAEKSRGEFGQLAQAIHENRQLWTLLAADVAADDNGLPADLRARIFYLYEFTNQHSRKVLKNPDEVSALVEINTAIMRGLRQTGVAA